MDSTAYGTVSGTASSVPKPDSHWALFLDIDGTLLDIAISPDAVGWPPLLTPLLARCASWLDGALALVSGRPLAQIDRLMAPLVLPCAGEHGAVIRLAGGAVEHAGAALAVPQAWTERLRVATRDWTGVLVEEKSYGVAVHFRKAPARDGEIRALVDGVVSENAEDFEALPASMAVEIRNRRLTKAEPVMRFMAQPPFRDRVPVFIGDDVTDQDGFRAALGMGGIALDVHQAFAGKPSEVLRWLDAGVPTKGH